MGRIKVHDGKWRVPGQPGLLQSWARSHPNRYWDDGTRLDAQGRRDLGFGILALFGLWIVVAWAYIFIADYTWTTAAVVLGVLVLFSLFTVGIMRTGGIILRFALWAFLLVVMSAAFSMLWSAECEQLTSGLQEAAVLAMGVAWLYGAIKLFRLVF